MLPLTGTKIPNLKYKVTDYKTVEVKGDGIESDELRALVDAGQPPIITISTDARTIREDWIRLEPTGHFGHMINVVGYGQAVEPFSLKSEDYFVVRDSFTDGDRHYRVKATELAASVSELGKVVAVGAK